MLDPEEPHTWNPACEDWFVVHVPAHTYSCSSWFQVPLSVYYKLQEKDQKKKKSKHNYLKELKISLKCLRVIAWVGNCLFNGKCLFKFLLLSYRVGTKDNLRLASPEKKIIQHLSETIESAWLRV